MPDQIWNPGPDDAPVVYEVPGTGEVVPIACQAEYDGTGAAGDFVPALIFRSQAGHVISRAILQSTITAGDDAEVSWFPGVKAGAPASGATELDIAYYEISGVASGTFPGTVHYAMSLTSTSSPAVFDVSSGFARINAPGAYFGYGFIDFGTTETFTAGAITEYRFGLEFTSFPFYTVGGPWKTVPASPSVQVYDTEFSAEFVVDATPINCRLFNRGPAVAPGGFAGGFLVLTRTRPLDWTF